MAMSVPGPKNALQANNTVGQSMRFSPWLVYGASLVIGWMISSIFIRDLAAAFLAGMFFAAVMGALVTGKINISRFGPSNIVGKESVWYWTFIVFLSACLIAVLFAAPKRDLRSLFSHSMAPLPNKSPEPTPTSVTIRAFARLAPAAVAAHL